MKHSNFRLLPSPEPEWQFDRDPEDGAKKIKEELRTTVSAIRSHDNGTAVRQQEEARGDFLLRI